MLTPSEVLLGLCTRPGVAAQASTGPFRDSAGSMSVPVQ